MGEVRKEGVLVGYSDESPSYRVWDPVKGKVLNVGGADFDEDVEPGWWKKIGEVGATLKEEDSVEFPDLAIDGDDSISLPLPPPSPPADDGEEETPELLEDDSNNEGGEDNNPPQPRRSARDNRGVPPLRYDDVFEAAVDLICPSTVEEALGGDQAEKWAEAMDSELESLWKRMEYMWRWRGLSARKS